MNPFKYSDEYISSNELMIAIPSIMIGVSVLSLPSEVASVTSFSDGWVSILFSGMIFTIMIVLGTKLVALFPNQSFLTYTSYLVSRPVAIVLTLINVCIGISLSALSVRSAAFISQQYLFEKTPMEVLAISFLLVVIYAVSGSRAGVFRLNILFLPIILVSFLFVCVMNIKWIEVENLLPLFQTDVSGYIKGVVKTYEVFLGFGIVLFYAIIVKRPKDLSRKVVMGIAIPIVFYIIVFLLSIGVFGNMVTQNLNFPMIELAKRVDIPGGIFERVDALFFTIWIMAIFNTVAIALDVSVFLLSSIFKRINKRLLTFILSPIIYYLSMFPQQEDQIKKISSIYSQFIAYFTITLTIGLLLIAKIRGANRETK